MKHVSKILFSLLLLFSVIKALPSVSYTSPKKYFCTVADKKHFNWLCNLLGSIHHTNTTNLEEIAVYDLGFTSEQRAYLRTLDKVVVCDLEMTHPDLKKPFLTNSNGKKVRGWYAWKPVVMKQALERYEYVLYIDAGNVVQHDLQDLFIYIQEHGHFLLEDPAWGVTTKNADGKNEFVMHQFSIEENATQFVLKSLNLFSPQLSWIRSTSNIYAGVQGISRQILQRYLLPVYELTKDLRYFQDDGTSRHGFGLARHDQTIFGIHARLAGFNFIKTCVPVTLKHSRGAFEMCCSYDDTYSPHIYFACKGQKDFTQYIELKKTN